MNTRSLTWLKARPAPSSPPLRSGLRQRHFSEQAEPSAVPPMVYDVLRSPGQPLDSASRAFMEPRFGHDFSNVRVHTDPTAVESARAVNALAYTVGRDVVFGAGRYTPGTETGRRLMAHELAHVVQQASGTASSALVGDRADGFERAADWVADAVTAGRGGPALPQAGQNPPLIQRQEAGTIPERPLQPSPFFLASVGSLTVDGFAVDGTDLTEDNKTLLDLHAKTLLILFQSDPDATVEVTGHTDATSTEKHNSGLGMKRAEAARDELATAGVPPEKLVVKSVGESELKVKTEAAEPRNRRVEVHFEPVIKLSTGTAPKISPPTLLPLLSPRAEPVPTPPRIPPRPLPILPPEPGPDKKLPGKPIPPALPTSDPIEDALDRDPVLRALPKVLRDPVKDAVKSGDETIADKALDTLNTDDQTKSVIKAAVKALLQTLKGQRGKLPTPPLHELPPSTMPEMPKVPGEKLFPLPPIIKW